ncbi:MAG: DUF4412 domain-containing protein [Crocinitomicaceae bacterium]|nr:DUF4412 domain-containing protein [Crocinitomicaceae bacterium]
MTVAAAISQAPFEGKIITEVKAVELPPEAKGMESMFNHSINIYVKGKNRRVEEGTAMGNTVIITLGEKNETIMLMDMMGQKIAVSMSPEENTPTTGHEPAKVELTNEKKMIAGYECKKAILTGTENPETIMEIWYTEKLPNATGKYESIAGMPMQYRVSANGMLLEFTVTKVAAEKVSTTLFEIPSGYTVKTKKELEGLMPMLGY